MHWGYRCLLSGFAGMALVAPAWAAPPRTGASATGTTQPAATGTTSGTGTTANAAPGSFKPPAPIQPGQPISVLTFPFGFAAPEGGATAAPAAPAAPAGTDTTTPAAPAPGTAAPAATALNQDQQSLASLVTASVKAGFLSSPYFQVATYSPNSALIQRAQKDEIIRVEQLSGLVAPDTGAVDVERARTIANRLAMQALLVGTIDAKRDAKKNTAEITLEAQLINSTTGEVIRSAAVSGAAAGADGVALQTVAERAGQEAAMKILPAMGIVLVPATSPNAPAASGAKKGKSHSKADDRKKAEADRKAERDAQTAAEREKRAQKDEQKHSRNTGRSESAATQSHIVPVAAPATGTAATGPAAAAPAAPAPAASAAPANSVTGVANAAGQPIPYGYAVGDSKSALPPRNRGGLRVPAWLGVAGFLTGVSFLL